MVVRRKFILTAGLRMRSSRRLDGYGTAGDTVEPVRFRHLLEVRCITLETRRAACDVIPSPQSPLPRMAVTPDFRVRSAPSVPPTDRADLMPHRKRSRTRVTRERRRNREEVH